MRISDWSSDVCSSDLEPAAAGSAVGSSVAATVFMRHRTVVLRCRAANNRCDHKRSEERSVGKEWSVRVDLGGCRIIKKKIILKKPNNYILNSRAKAEHQYTHDKATNSCYSIPK